MKDIKYFLMKSKKNLKEIANKSVLALVITRVTVSLFSLIFIIGIYSANLKFKELNLKEAILFQLISITMLNSDLIQIDTNLFRNELKRNTICNRQILPISLITNYTTISFSALLLLPSFFSITLIYSFINNFPPLKVLFYLLTAIVLYNFLYISIEVISFSLEILQEELGIILKQFYMNLLAFGRYPESAFDEAIKTIFTYFLPLMIIANAPYKAIAKNSGKLLILSSISIFSLFLFSIVIYKIAIKKIASS